MKELRNETNIVKRELRCKALFDDIYFQLIELEILIDQIINTISYAGQGIVNGKELYI